MSLPTPTPRENLGRWRDERNSAVLYRAFAEIEQSPQLSQVYQRLAAVEAGHAQAMEEALKRDGHPVPVFAASTRTRILIAIARRFGIAAVLPSVASVEEVAAHSSRVNADQRPLEAQERSHARLLTTITGGLRGGLEGEAIARLEGRHRTAGGNALRAAVLGANDGLVSNFSLVMGVAGAELAGSSILITGLAGLLAGAISMALGEWISVQSSRELYAHQIGLERAELEARPEEEREELALIYQSRGMDAASASKLADQVMASGPGALETLAREELNLDPKELGGSAWEAAITSFVLFALGAIIPVAPYFFTSGLTAVVISTVLSAAGLFMIGAAITLFTGRNIWVSGGRQVVFGLAAAAITYAIGRLVGVSVG